MKKKKDFELLEHMADINLRVYGDTMAELFRNALIGMFQSVEPQSPKCKKIDGRLVCQTLPQIHTVEVTSPDRNALLVDFLSESLYLSDIHYEAYFDATINELTDQRIKAELHGVKITGFTSAEIKSVTYHGLDIQEKNGIFQADIVFDI